MELNFMRSLLLFLSIALSLACSGTANNAKPNVNNSNANNAKAGPLPVYGYEVVKAYPHDPKAFTEGLFYYDGFLYESTGEEGKSSLRKVELETGKVVQKWDMPREDFGEGIAALNGQIYQMTWRQGLCRVFDEKDFKLIRELNYQGEGWGMTTDGTNFIMSDGTHILKVMDPNGFKPIRKIAVLQDNGKPLFLLNELEFIKGEVWANIWHSDEAETGTTQGQMPNISKPNYIARIDPDSGRLLGWIDLAGISPDDQGKESQRENTLNGIAYDAEKERIFVTGKNWKKLYEIKITTPKGQ
jgi:glutaminyl-peptide cyclotransferase